MPFKREHEMLEPVTRWLEARGMMVKAEFTNPWGVCDLVGCSFDPEKVAKRLALGQRQAIGPAWRILILNKIPCIETRRWITLQELKREFRGLFDATTIAGAVDRLVAGHFVSETLGFQRRNSSFPLHQRLVAIELKLSRITEAFHQARANRELTHESYAAFPLTIARGILTSKRCNEFTRARVGILGVTEHQCRELLSATPAQDHPPDVVAQTHCVERFWRTRNRKAT